MNTDMNAILARIQNGENPEDIANEFASIMNAAIKANEDAIQKQKEAEAAAIKAREVAAAREAALNDAANKMAVALKEYAIAAYPSLTDIFADEEIDTAVIRSTMDAALASVILAMSFEAAPYAPAVTVTPKKATIKPPQSSDEALANFLKNFVD